MSVQPSPNPSVDITPGPATETSLGALVQSASADISALVRAEIEMAKLETVSGLKRGGIGAGMFAAAGAVLLFASIFGFIALAEGLVTLGIWRWAAYLIVCGSLLFLAVLLVIGGVKLMKRIKPPTQAIASTKDTVSYLRNTSQSS